MASRSAHGGLRGWIAALPIALARRNEGVGLLDEELNRAAAALRHELLGDVKNPSAMIADAQAYHWLVEEVVKTLPSRRALDGDAAEEELVAQYVRHLAATHRPCEACGTGLHVDDEDVVLVSTRKLAQVIHLSATKTEEETS